MPVEFTRDPLPQALPVRLVSAAELNDEASGLSALEREWAAASAFRAEQGSMLLLPGTRGEPAGALLGWPEDAAGFAALSSGALARLPDGDWRIEGSPADAHLFYLGIALGSYRFTRYGKKAGTALRFALPDGVDAARLEAITHGMFLARDLVNTPTSDLGPSELEKQARGLAAAYGAAIEVVTGDDLLAAGFPMIHSVGRAAADAPRLIDLTWGNPGDMKVTLVGKGVCFDTGGLDIKPSSAMLLMKKDMGGAAAALGLAAMIMAQKLPVRLRVLVPAVENAISGNAFRPGDILTSRKGLTVEIGNTDAEGRLVLADALALADEEAPDLLVDLATLTGAARVALGPDIPPFFTGDETLARDLARAAEEVADPLWRLPLWKPYAAKLSSRVADTNNVTSDGFAGSVTAALFLEKFVEKARAWVHFDIYGWNPADRPHCPQGGEAQAIRALETVIRARCGVTA